MAADALLINYRRLHYKSQTAIHFIVFRPPEHHERSIVGFLWRGSGGDSSVEGGASAPTSGEQIIDLPPRTCDAKRGRRIFKKKVSPGLTCPFPGIIIVGQAVKERVFRGLHPQRAGRGESRRCVYGRRWLRSSARECFSARRKRTVIRRSRPGLSG